MTPSHYGLDDDVDYVLCVVGRLTLEEVLDSMEDINWLYRCVDWAVEHGLKGDADAIAAYLTWWADEGAEDV